MTGVRCQTHLDVGCGALRRRRLENLYGETWRGLTTPARLTSRTTILGANFIVCDVPLAALIHWLPTHSAVLMWSALRANRFAREPFVAV